MSASKNKARWVVTLIVGIILVAMVAGLAIQLDRSTTTTRIGSERYAIGGLTAEGEYKDTALSIYTPNGIKIDGLDIEVADKDSGVEYQLYFYDKDNDFLSRSDVLTADFDGSIPEGAKTVKIVITPNLESGDNINLFEISNVAKQLTVTVNR